MTKAETPVRLAERLSQFLSSIQEEQRQIVARRLLNWQPERIQRFLDDPRAIALAERAPAKRDEPVTYFPTPWHLADYVENGKEANPRHLQILDGLTIRGLRQGGVMSLVSMHPRSGKALAIDEPVWTTRGWVAHGDLRVGDEVFAPDGTPTAVVQTHPVEELPTFRCSTDHGHSSVRASGAHLWWVRLNGRMNYTVETTAFLAERGGKAPRLPAQEPLQGPELALPMDPWMLGYWLGNGTRTHGLVTGHIEDRSYVEGRMMALYGEVREPTSVERRRADGGSAFAAASSALTADLRATGVLLRKHVPELYLRASEHQRLELLRGMVDSDGYVAPDGQVEITFMDAELMDGLVQLLRTLGIRAHGPTIRRATLNGIDAGEAQRVTFYHQHAAGSPRRAARLEAAAASKLGGREPVGRHLRVEPTGLVEPVSCITVDRPDGAYLAGRGLIPTHNSRRLLRFAPLWLLHRDPTRRIGAFSYNPKIPGDASEYCRDVIERHGPALGLSLKGRNTRLDWRVKGAEDSSYFAGGLKGAATGLGFTDLFIDDPLSGVAEALNAKIKEERYEIIKGNLMTRLQPGGNLYLVGCFRGDQRVLMADATWKPISEISAGETVARFDHEQRRMVAAKVLDQRSSGYDQILRIQSTTSSVLCNARHPFLVAARPRARARWQWEWRQASQLKPGDIVVTSRAVELDVDPAPTFNVVSMRRTGQNRWGRRQVIAEHAEPVAVDPDLAWFLGFFLGDGWVVHNRKRPYPAGFCVALGSDGHLNDRMERIARAVFGSCRRHARTRYLRNESSVAGRSLEAFGLGGNAHTKRIPEAVYRWPLALRVAFLRGLLDADGHRDRPKRRRGSETWSLELCNDELVQDAIRLAKTSGVRTSKVYRRTRVQRAPRSPVPTQARSSMARFLFDGPDTNEAMVKGGCVDGSVRFEKIRSVELTPSTAEVFDLAVDGESFICEGFAVHNTRWAEDDPIGRIINDPEIAPKFTVIRFAALAEENDPLGRKPGEALWPEVWGVEALETRRRMVGEYWFAALYQGRPTPTSGSLFDRGNVRYFLPGLIPGEVELITDHGSIVKKIVMRFMTVDLAIGQKDENDFTCVCTWDVTADADLILRSIKMERFSGPTQGPIIIAEHRAFGGKHPVYVEAVQYQLALVQGLQQAGLPAQKVLPKGDKVARSNPAQSLWRQNKVFLPREHPDHDEMLKQLGDFNRGEHDDFVDCLSYAALVLMKALRPAEAEEELLQRLIDEFDIEIPQAA